MMNEQDKKAFEDFCESLGQFGYSLKEQEWIKPGAWLAWQACCEYRDGLVGEAVFWYRPRSDGAYEGPIHNSSIEDVRKNSGSWIPLYTTPPTTQINQALVEALSETQRDLTILLGNIFASSNKDKNWEGMYDVVNGWITRNHKAIEKAEAALQAARGEL